MMMSGMWALRCNDAEIRPSQPSDLCGYRRWYTKCYIHGLKIVGRIGIGNRGMNLENPDISRQMQYTDLRRDLQPDASSSLSSQGTDSEFEHEAADYQWLLDYEYRENYSRDSLAPVKDGSVRVSILQTAENGGDFSYEAISRNLDANLAEIDMDDFRSEDIHQILSLPSAENEYEDENDAKFEEYKNQRDEIRDDSCVNPYYSEEISGLRRSEENEQEAEQQDAKETSCNYIECAEEEDVDCSGVSGEISFYKSGPLFSPLREPIPPSFSVDSLDSGSMHEDLILTCQANKDNYTIAFEGSFIHNSSNSDYRDTGTSESGESATWSTENLEDHIPASDMTHSDQPYTTWSRVSRRLSQTPESDPSYSVVRHDTTPVPKPNPAKEPNLRPRGKSHTNESKSSSMPNLMRRSLMRKSLEASGQCVKVYDLQKSLRTNHLSQSKVDANNFSLLRLFMKQKSLGKDAITRSSSFTDRSNDGCYSSSENHSTNNESSDWPMNSQSETDLESSSSPVQNCYRNVKISNQNHVDTGAEFDNVSATAEMRTRSERIERLNNNNNTITHHIDNVTLHLNSIDNLNGFDDSLRDAITCSKPPMTSPIREEPEGMEMSTNQQIFSVSKSEVPTAWNPVENLSRDSSGSESNIITNNSSIAKNTGDGKLESSEHLKISYKREALKEGLQHCKSDASGRRTSSRDKPMPSKGIEERKAATNLRERPKPRPRLTKEFSDQCLQTSNLKSSGAVNTSKIFDQKEVYVYYPNYALPDLNFLQDKKYSLDTKIFLVPQHYSMPEGHRSAKGFRSGRPLSHNDITKLKKDNFSHVEDWESLNFLLPKELKQILKDSSDCMETMKPSFCRPLKSSQRPRSTDFSPQRTFNESKGSSTSINSTQPSSGYRGSSTLLNESDSEDALIGGNTARCLNTNRRMRPSSSDGVSNLTETTTLPKGVLRKCTTIRGSKRSSCDIDNNIRMREELLKRRSLPEFDERKEEFFAGKSPLAKCHPKESKSMNCSCVNHCTGFCSADLRTKNVTDPASLSKTRASAMPNATEMKNLKTRVSNQLYSVRNNKPLHKTIGGQRPSELSIKRDVGFRQSIPAGYNCSTGRDNSAKINQQAMEDLPPMVYDLGEKKTLVISVRSAVEKLVSYFQLATPREKLQIANSPNGFEVAQLVLNKLCPAIYALLSDGLLPSLHSLFGKITNSVWKVVETTSQLGPSTKALHDLVMTLNGEECLTEGPIKCNAFIFGLLNLRSLDAWLSYLRTREVALQKHYHPESFLYLANTAMRSLFDDLILALRPLALLPFHLDIMFEYKALHASLVKMEERFFMTSRREGTNDATTGSVFDNLVFAKESKEFRNVAAQQDRIRAFVKAIDPQQVEIRRDRSNSPRPRSCYEGETTNPDVQDSLKKRWSGVQLGSKLVTALDKLLSEADDSSGQDYTDSIDNVKARDNCSTELKLSDTTRKYENSSEFSASDKDTDNEKFANSKYSSKNSGNTESEGDRFRRLQLKWEQMAIHPLRHRNSHTANSISPGCTSRSRIPRPVSITSPQRPYKPFEPITLTKDKPKPTPRRSLKDKNSFADPPGRHVIKPRLKNKKSPTVSADSSRASSVPGRGVDSIAPLPRYDVYRRNASARSSSQGREVIGNFRYVETLHHRMATDNGHLSFNKGDLLSVVIDVDEKFILCCLNDRKGIVPRSSVIPFNP